VVREVVGAGGGVRGGGRRSDGHPDAWSTAAEQAISTADSLDLQPQQEFRGGPSGPELEFHKDFELRNCLFFLQNFL
jgi:hypothetical protein